MRAANRFSIDVSASLPTRDQVRDWPLRLPGSIARRRKYDLLFSPLVGLLTIAKMGEYQRCVDNGRYPSELQARSFGSEQHCPAWPSEFCGHEPKRSQRPNRKPEPPRNAGAQDSRAGSPPFSAVWPVRKHLQKRIGQVDNAARDFPETFPTAPNPWRVLMKPCEIFGPTRIGRREFEITAPGLKPNWTREDSAHARASFFDRSFRRTSSTKLLWSPWPRKCANSPGSVHDRQIY